MPFSKRTSLGTGFGVILSLLVLSTALAYEIQESFSARSVAIHRHYVQQQQVLSDLRRVLYRTGIFVRDFLLNRASDRQEVFSRQIAELRTASEPLLDRLRDTGAKPAAVDELQRHVRELWTALERTLHIAPGDVDSYDYVQQEIAPRRSEAGRILEDLESANHSALTVSEREFSETRSAAASNLLWLLACCVVVGAGVAWFSLHYSNHLEGEAAARFQEVLQAKEELERLSKRLMEIQEEERTRLSRELHDEIVQNVAVLKLEITQALASLPNTTVKERLAQARELADRTVSAVRNISLLLRPSLLDDLGLGPALQWQTEDFRRRTGVPCEYIEINLSSDLSDAVNTCVYRVTQEALRNCEKHSQASHVLVRVAQQATVLTVDVEDNGQGFDPHRRNFSSLGVLGMRERAAALGGEVRIDSAAGRGTKVQLQLPVGSMSVQSTFIKAHA